MKKYITYSFALSLALLCSVGCESLTQINPNYTTIDAYWEDLKDTESGLIAAYASLRNDNVLSIQEEAWRADLAWPGYGRPMTGSNEIGWAWYNQLYNASSVAVGAKWDALYTGVWRANQVIEALEAMEETKGGNEELWYYQMGQAKFLRGLFYFYLHSSFNEGKVVIRNNCPEKLEDFNTPLSSSDEVLAFFRKDLTDALELLRTYPSTNATYSAFATYGTVLTILGTSHLYEGEYADAKTCFEDVINCGLYTLETDLSKMFTDAGEFNSESILEIPYSTEFRTDINEYNTNAMTNILATTTMQTAGCYLPSWLAVAYQTEPMDPNSPLNDVDPAYAAKYKRNVSRRASAMVTLVMDEITPYYLNDNMGYFTNSCGAQQGVYGVGRYKKYTNHDILEKELVCKSGRNIIVNRLSDVYLMYAECCIQDGGDITTALNYINQIRSRWGLLKLGVGTPTDSYDGVAYDAESLMDRIMYYERPLELSHEGHQIRWQDLRRWGLLKDNDENIFRQHHNNEAFIFYNFSPKHLPGSTATNVETRKCAFAIQIDRSDLDTPTPVAPTDQAYIDSFAANKPEIDATFSKGVAYEYEGAAKYYKEASNAYYPIPDSEIRNNSSLQ